MNICEIDVVKCDYICPKGMQAAHHPLRAPAGTARLLAPLQIAGIALIATAITAYMVLQWLAARAADSSVPAAAAALTGGCAGAAQPVGALVGMRSDSGTELSASGGSEGSSAINSYLSGSLSTVVQQLSHLICTTSLRTHSAVCLRVPCRLAESCDCHAAFHGIEGMPVIGRHPAGSGEGSA